MADVRINSNKITLRGVLTKDAEIKNYQDKRYANISIMTTIAGRKSFNSLTIWNEEMISCVESMQKDTPIEMVGRLVDKKYESKDGKKLSKIEILPYEIKRCDEVKEDVNYVELYGRLVATPTSQTTTGGKLLVRASIAVANKKSKAKEGPADFFNITLWDRNAEEAAKMEKAQWVELTAMLRNTKYEKNGQTFYSTEVVPNLFRKKIWEDRGEANVGSNQYMDSNVYDDVDLGYMSMDSISDEDMPFN